MKKALGVFLFLSIVFPSIALADIENDVFKEANCEVPYQAAGMTPPSPRYVVTVIADQFVDLRLALIYQHDATSGAISHLKTVPVRKIIQNIFGRQIVYQGDGFELSLSNGGLNSHLTARISESQQISESAYCHKQR